MSSKNFTKVDNRIIQDKNLSVEAKGLYVILVNQYLIPGFKLYKKNIQNLTGLGETKFNRIWKELKAKGILTQVKKRVKGKFVYEYTLQISEKKEIKEDIQEKKQIKKTASVKVDSDGNKPIQGQIDVNEVITTEDIKETTKKNENIEIITNTTELNRSQAEKLLIVANSSYKKVIESYKYVMLQQDVKDIFNYTKWAIQNNKTLNINPTQNNLSKSNIVGHFNNFEQRQYNFKALESALLGQEYKSLYN